jgi:integrase
LGRVFKLTTKGSDKQMVPGEVGRLVSLIGKKAGVVVDKAAGKFGSCHDLRRSFGTRWAKRVMPAVLRRLMRHSTVQTTMTYYVDIDAAEVADELWAKFGNTTDQGNISGNIAPKAAKVGHA